MIKVKYDQEIKEFNKGITYYEVCKSFNIEQSALAVSINNEILSLTDIIEADCTLGIIDKKDAEGSNIYKSGLKFLFEVALKKVYPNAEIYYDHSVPQGMLGYIKTEKSFTQEDIFNIRDSMKKLIDSNKKINNHNILKKDAIKFYNDNKDYEKADNVSHVSDNIVDIYELDGFYNFFYTKMPYSTEVINEYELVYLGNNRLIFLFPSKKTNYKVPEYVHYGNIIDSFNENKKWLNRKKMPFVNSLNSSVGNCKIKDFIKTNEIKFNLNISKVADEIMRNNKIKFVMIAGPSSSGKTTTTKRLADYLEASGYDAIKISTDDYFVDREDNPQDENGNLDFECLEAIDLKYLNDDLKKLLAGEVINMPVYNFILGKKEKSLKSTVFKENSIILIEGLHSLNDLMLPNIDNSSKYKIYLSPFMALNVDKHNYVSTIDLRLIRRIVRDNRSRGYGVATTIHNWHLVRGGEEKYIFPFIHQANVIINTALAYEIGVLKVYVEPLLLSVGVTSKYYAEAQRLLCFLRQFFPIPGEYVNKESILREFIGGQSD